MTGRLEVEAQWALYGASPDGAGHRILASSTGALSRANFADAVSRFKLGAVDRLPQVSVSYARLADQPGVGYLALAIDDFAADRRRTMRDRNGRKVIYTSYFCLPYRPLTELAIGYLGSYQALRGLTLPACDGPPLSISLFPPTLPVVGVDPLAIRVAALLLAGRPVCVLGADATSTDERLRFIDTVMDLLPYGLRARMTAATWTRATHSGHRFRLFFSSAPCPGRPADQVVTWGQPDQVAIPDGPPAEYLRWLEDNVRPLARLAGLTGERGFGQHDILQVLELAVAGSGAPSPATDAPAAAAEKESHDPGRPGTSAAATGGDAGEDALRRCAEHLLLANAARLRSDIGLVGKLAAGEVSEDRRQRYRALIAELGLLRHDAAIEGKDAERLCDALLALAFGAPVSYQAYCQLEKCAGVHPGDAPRRELLAAVARAGLPDLAAAAIVGWHLKESDEKQLNRWLASGETDAVTMINLLASPWTHPQHARIFCDVTLECLTKTRERYDPLQLRAALRAHGFLAGSLQRRHPDDDQYQVSTLYQFLRAAYPQANATPGQGLSRAAILQVLAGSDRPPTPALLAAVVMLAARPEGSQLAREAYAYGSLTLMNLDEPTRTRLLARLPEITRASFPVAAGESADPPG